MGFLFAVMKKVLEIDGDVAPQCDVLTNEEIKISTFSS